MVAIQQTNHLHENVLETFCWQTISPQEFINSQWQLVSIGQPVKMDITFHTTPISLSGISTCSSSWVHEILAMVDSMVDDKQPFRQNK